MKIDRSNYESFLLDFLDGNLSEEDRQSVAQFLAANPDLADEFSEAKEMQALRVDLPSIDKSNLYKSFADLTELSDNQFEELCVAYHEGDLEPSMMKELERLIRFDASRKALFELHRQLHVTPDLGLFFPGKQQLRKPRIIPLRRILYLGSTGIAAVLTGILVFRFVSKPAEDLPADTVLNAPRIAHIEAEKQLPLNPVAPETKVSASRVNLSKANAPVQKLAALDTSQKGTPGTVILAELTPVPAQIEPVSAGTMDELSQISSMPPNIPDNKPSLPASIQKANSYAISKTRIINRETLFWTAVQAGVKGFNTLTENDLALDTEQNKKGQITGLKIYAENFEFQRKFKKNNQN